MTPSPNKTEEAEQKGVGADAAFLRDLAERLFKVGTPAMGFDQGDTDQLYRIARSLNSHDDLVAALRGVRDAYRDPECGEVDRRLAIKDADRALSHALGESK